MSDPHDTAPGSPLAWGEDGQPRSLQFGDVYFSTVDGLAESRAVFLQGCGMPEAWAGRERFVVGELGFGTGLNILALLDLWRRSRPSGGRLHVFTVEAYPLQALEARRAVEAWPEIAELADLLTGRWPGRARGMHRVELPELGCLLDLFVGDVEEALAGWAGQADAWFLDGFSPAVNSQMWSEKVLSLVAARSAPGARAATFTVAGAVRRGLSAAGFQVEKQPGFGRKRERLTARLEDGPARALRRRVAIIGGGIGGASAARAVRELGGEAILIEAEASGTGASGNPAALATPRLDAGLGPPAALFAQCFRRAVQLYAQVPEAVLARGVLQLFADARDEARFRKIAESGLFEPDALTILTAAEASIRLGEPAPAALGQESALVVAPDLVLAAWSGPVVRAQVTALEPRGDRWTLLGGREEIVEAEAVILATGAARPLAGLWPLLPVRGQASWVDRLDGIRPAAAWGGYAAPTAEGLLFGATHDRGDEGTELRAQDHARNLAMLAQRLPQLAARIEGLPLGGRASVRATTPDRLPVAGELQPGLFVLGGLGSRGFSFAPLLGEHLAAQALGAPSPIPEPLARLLRPQRFARETNETFISRDPRPI